MTPSTVKYSHFVPRHDTGALAPLSMAARHGAEMAQRVEALWSNFTAATARMPGLCFGGKSSLHHFCQDLLVGLF